jgi:hypothetical protein
MQSISWEVLADDAEPRLRFIWSETRNPKGPTSSVKASNSGRKLLERIVPQAFSGKATLTVAAARVTWLLVAPLTRVGNLVEGASAEGSGKFSL